MKVKDIFYMLIFVVFCIGMISLSLYAVSCDREKHIKKDKLRKCEQTINMDLRSSEKDSIIKYYLKDKD